MLEPESKRLHQISQPNRRGNTEPRTRAHERRRDNIRIWNSGLIFSKSCIWESLRSHPRFDPSLIHTRSALLSLSLSLHTECSPWHSYSCPISVDVSEAQFTRKAFLSSPPVLALPSWCRIGVLNDIGRGGKTFCHCSMGTGRKGPGAARPICIRHQTWNLRFGGFGPSENVTGKVPRVQEAPALAVFYEQAPSHSIFKPSRSSGRPDDRSFPYSYH
ncbi:hypothetical protein V8F20_000551 [Naviculisporaceae sp. PSN 640]